MLCTKVNPSFELCYGMFQLSLLENDFLRARGYLVAGVLTRTSGSTLHELAGEFLQKTLNAVTNDPSEVVRASCVKVLQDYLQALPRSITSSLQGPIISAISTFLASQDLAELVDSDDVLVTLVETLRDAILVDTRICIEPGSEALNLLFSVASHSASNFQITALVNETFEEVAGSIGTFGGDTYIRLCEKVLPSLAGAFDVGDMTEESALRNVSDRAKYPFSAYLHC
jgi:importin-9